MERTCEYCGTLLVGRKDKRFCCRECKKKNLRHPHRKHKGTLCTLCGFVPIHICQLDVHHINGDHSDNRPENLTTLCANCHRLAHVADRGSTK